jgi:hypothetical protein
MPSLSMWEWIVGIPLGVLVAVGTVIEFTRLIFRAGEKEEMNQ